MDAQLQAVLLALVQGLTEFLPVSSSAHLILPAQLWGWADQGLAFDVAVHFGSLLAVLIYLRRDIADMLSAVCRSARTGERTAGLRLLFYLGLATLPVGLAGVLLGDFVERHLRSVEVIAGATIGFGILMGVADYYRRAGPGVEYPGTAAPDSAAFGSTVSALNARRALLIGLAQVAALIPGTSRAGVTITAALFCGLGRTAAARFSLLLSIPVILAASLLQAVALTRADTAPQWGVLLLAVAVAALTAYLAIAWFLRLVGRIGLLPFVFYRCVLGLLLAGMLYL